MIYFLACMQVIVNVVADCELWNVTVSLHCNIVWGWVFEVIDSNSFKGVATSWKCVTKGKKKTWKNPKLWTTTIPTFLVLIIGLDAMRGQWLCDSLFSTFFIQFHFHIQ
jgi:hypothetical protein